MYTSKCFPWQKIWYVLFWTKKHIFHVPNGQKSEILRCYFLARKLFVCFQQKTESRVTFLQRPQSRAIQPRTTCCGRRFSKFFEIFSKNLAARRKKRLIWAPFVHCIDFGLILFCFWKKKSNFGKNFDHCAKLRKARDLKDRIHVKKYVDFWRCIECGAIGGRRKQMCSNIKHC